MRMIPKYESHFQHQDIDTFVDLFGGSGMMSYWIHKTRPRAKIILNEINPCLVGVFLAIRDDYEEFKKICSSLESEYLSLGFHDENGNPKIFKKKELNLVDKPKLRPEYYFMVRDRFNKRFQENSDSEVMKDIQASAEMFFLLKTCFNGIWQGSAKTRFSTPPGHCKESCLFVWEDILDFKGMLDKADIYCGSFEQVPVPEGEGVLVYADPPYVKSSTKYDNVFGEKETKLLCSYLLKCNMWAMSNKDHEVFRDMLSGAEFHEFDVKYSASRTDTENASATEVLITHGIQKLF